jgi:FG-GAP-like repeat
MAEDKNTGGQSWWSTLPGVVTALAALVTAVAGLLASFNQLMERSEKTSIPVASAQVERPVPTEVPAVSIAGNPDPALSNATETVATKNVIPAVRAVNGQNTLELGRDKLLWRNQATGELSAWLFDSSGIVVGKRPLSLSCDTASGCSSDWTALGTGDFDGDKAVDVLWRDKKSGELSVWLVSKSGTVLENRVLSSKCEMASGCSADWSFVGIGAFNGDQFADVLWHNKKSGELTAWLFSSSGEVSGEQTLSWRCDSPSGCSSDWRTAGVGDFNSDGVSDVLWRNGNTGLLSAWLTTWSGEVTSEQALSWKCDAESGCNSSWSVVDAADFNGDRVTDVLWFNKSAGELSAWLLSPTGQVTGTMELSWKCEASSGCQNDWSVVGGL